MVKLLAYIIRWQLSTPILYGCMAWLPFGGGLTRTFIANLIGALIFYPVDKLIMRRNAQ